MSGVVVCLVYDVVTCGKVTGSCQSLMSVDVGVCGMSLCQGFESRFGCRVGNPIAGVGLIGVGGVVSAVAICGFVRRWRRCSR